MRHMSICAGVVVALASSVAWAVPIYSPTIAADFNALLGGSATPVAPAMVTDFSGGNLSATVVSQAFTDGAGEYLYLYQLLNTGSTSSDVITRFTINPFVGATSQVQLGYVTANVPADFELGAQAPLYGDVDVVAGPTVGFAFPVGNPIYNIPDSYIAPGVTSKVLYVLSQSPPGVVTGNVINGGVHADVVVGPVPEPATVGLLLLGMPVLLRRHRK